MSVTVDRVREVIVPLLADLDVELYDVELIGGSLRVTLDRPGGIDVDAITRATRAISAALDEADPVPGAYTLEVSSPGLERQLRTPEHFQGAVGEDVKVKTRAGVEGDRRAEGRLSAVDDGTVTIELDDGATRTLSIDDIERARTVFEWGPAPKPGKQSTSSKSSKSSKSSNPTKPNDSEATP